MEYGDQRRPGSVAPFLLFLFLRLQWALPYAGIGHVLPVVLLLAVLRGVTLQAFSASRSKLWEAAVTMTLVAGGASALPVICPWEYFNENRYFSDERG